MNGNSGWMWKALKRFKIPPTLDTFNNIRDDDNSGSANVYFSEAKEEKIQLQSADDFNLKMFIFICILLFISWSFYTTISA